MEDKLKYYNSNSNHEKLEYFVFRRRDALPNVMEVINQENQLIASNFLSNSSIKFLTNYDNTIDNLNNHVSNLDLSNKCTFAQSNKVIEKFNIELEEYMNSNKRKASTNSLSSICSLDQSTYHKSKANKT